MVELASNDSSNAYHRIPPGDCNAQSPSLFIKFTGVYNSILWQGIEKRENYSDGLQPLSEHPEEVITKGETGS